MRPAHGADAPRQFEAVNVGHVIVGHHEADIGIGLQDFERLGAAICQADAEIIALEAARKQRPRRRAVINDQHMVAVVGEKAADGFRQHIHGENIVLQDIIDHILGDQRFARPLVKGAGENDGRDRKIDQIFQRLALFRPRQVDVGNRQRHRFGRMFVTGLQLLEIAAHFHGNAQ
ncbi:hypothetical protein D3C80_741530 [compost metagenome]